MSPKKDKKSSVKFDNDGQNTSKRHSTISTAESMSGMMGSKCRCKKGECIAQQQRRHTKSETEEEWSVAEIDMVMSQIGMQASEYLLDLEQYISIKSLSSSPKHFKQTRNILEVTITRLEELKFSVEEVPVVFKNKANVCKKHMESTIILATHFCSPKKNTILAYGYLDVVAAEKSDGWLTDPFQLSTNEGLLIGRGVASGKGPLLCWFNAIDAWLRHAEELPVNMKFVIEVMHENGSVGLKRCIATNPEFFEDVDHIMMFTNSWLNDETPLIQYALSGWVYFGLEVTSANKDMESGTAGGIVYECLTELIHLMNSMLDNQNVPKITNLHIGVNPLTEEDWNLLDATKFRIYDYKERFDIRRLPQEISKSEILQNRWCRPTLTLHGVRGAYGGKYTSCVIPGKVVGLFSVKLVPDQDVDSVKNFVKEYLEHMYEVLNLNCQMELRTLDSSKPHKFPIDSNLLEAIRIAMKRVHGIKPTVSKTICACMPIANIFAEYTSKDVMLLPFSSIDDRRLETNESISETLYMRNTMMCAAIMHEISKLPVKCHCDTIPDYCLRRGLSEVRSIKKIGPMESVRKYEEIYVTPATKKLIEKVQKKPRFKCSSCWPLRMKKHKGSEETKSTKKGKNTLQNLFQDKLLQKTTKEKNTRTTATKLSSKESQSVPTKVSDSIAKDSQVLSSRGSTEKTQYSQGSISQPLKGQPRGSIEKASVNEAPKK